jgi:hypothetical protein
MTPPLATIELINACTVLTDDQIAAWLPALQAQVSGDFYPRWGRDAKLIFTPKGSRPHPGTWWAAVTDNSDAAGALGYHDITPAGLPTINIFAGTALQFGLSPSVTASHEIVETLADAHIDKAIQVGALFYAYEIADACEEDRFGYQIDGVLVSDFVTPAWFDGTDGPFDRQGAITAPRQLLAGGYIGVLDLNNVGAGWGQIDAREPAHPARRNVTRGSRRDRRRRGSTAWRVSAIDMA